MVLFFIFGLFLYISIIKSNYFHKNKKKIKKVLTPLSNSDTFVLPRQRTPNKKLCQQQQQKETK